MTVVLIPIVIARIATGDPPIPSDPPSQPPAEQATDSETPPAPPPAKPPVAPTITPLPPPPVYVPPPVCGNDVEFYGDVSLWYGISDLHADTGSGRTDAGTFRNAGGFIAKSCNDGVRGVDFRGGLVLDLAGLDLGGTAIGAEVGIDWPVSTTWRAGFRTSVTVGNTTQYWIGARAQTTNGLSFGLDVVNSANHTYSNGDVITQVSTHAALLGFGLTGKPGRYVMLAEAITSAIVVGLVIVACVGGGCGG